MHDVKATICACDFLDLSFFCFVYSDWITVMNRDNFWPFGVNVLKQEFFQIELFQFLILFQCVSYRLHNSWHCVGKIVLIGFSSPLGDIDGTENIKCRTVFD